jgi:hypothetical protein
MDYNTESDISEKNKLEHFDQKKIKNACHYACSSMNYTNIIILIIVIILIYHVVMTNFLK